MKFGSIMMILPVVCPLNGAVVFYNLYCVVIKTPEILSIMQVFTADRTGRDPDEDVLT